jgi:hypothetical protein
MSTTLTHNVSPFAAGYRLSAIAAMTALAELTELMATDEHARTIVAELAPAWPGTVGDLLATVRDEAGARAVHDQLLDELYDQLISQLDPSDLS